MSELNMKKYVGGVVYWTVCCYH